MKEGMEGEKDGQTIRGKEMIEWKNGGRGKESKEQKGREGKWKKWKKIIFLWVEPLWYSNQCSYLFQTEL